MVQEQEFVDMVTKTRASAVASKHCSAPKVEEKIEQA